MDKKYQVFISSTYTDLKEERQAVVQTILDTDNIPAGMELFKGGKGQKETIKRWIEESDIYVLILGGRYGSIDEETGKSYTQWEYDLAVELNKPLFAIVLADDYVNSTLKPSESDMGKDKYISFKTKVINENNGGKIVGFVNSIDQIKNEIYRNIPNIEKEHSAEMVGWVSADRLEELKRLKEENKRLSNELLNRQTEVIDFQKELNVVKDNFIGPFSFDYVKKQLENSRIDPYVIHCNAEYRRAELITRDYDSPLPGTGSKARDMEELNEIIDFSELTHNVFDLLLRYKGSMLVDGFKIYPTPLGKTLLQEFIPVLNQFSLIDIEMKESNTINIHGNIPNRNHHIITLNDNGKKFLTMLKMEENN